MSCILVRLAYVSPTKGLQYMDCRTREQAGWYLKDFLMRELGYDEEKAEELAWHTERFGYTDGYDFSITEIDRS